MVGISEFFANLTGAKPAQAAPQNMPTPGNIPTNAGAASSSASTQTTAPNGTVPSSAQPIVEQQKSPLDEFGDLWKTAPNATPEEPLFKVTHEGLLGAARKQNFTPELTQEQMAAIVGGGEGAAKAMLSVMNDMAQQVYAQGAYASTKLIDGALTKSQFAKAGDIQSQVRKEQVNLALSENPIYNHPAAQPMIEAIRDKMVMKFPNASPQELTALTNQYFTEFTDAFNAPKRAQEAKAQNKVNPNEDWSRFFSNESNNPFN